MELVSQSLRNQLRRHGRWFNPFDRRWLSRSFTADKDWRFLRDLKDRRTKMFLAKEREIQVMTMNDRKMKKLAQVLIDHEMKIWEALPAEENENESSPRSTGVVLGEFEYFVEHGPNGCPVAVFRIPVNAMDSDTLHSVFDIDEVRDFFLENRYGEVKDHTYLEFGEFKVSDDGRHAAIAVRIGAASEHFSVVFRNLHSKNLFIHEGLSNIHSMTWFKVRPFSEQNTLFFTEMDNKARPCQVWRASVSKSGDKMDEPIQVFEEKDPRASVDVSTTKDNAYLLINSNTKSTSEVTVLDEAGMLHCLRRRQEGLQYFVDHCGDRFWIVSNLDSLDGNYRVFSSKEINHDDGALELSSWSLAPFSDSEFNVEEMDTLEKHIITFERSKQDASQLIRISDPQGKQLATIPLQPLRLTCEPVANPLFHDATVHFTVFSPRNPQTQVAVNLSNTPQIDLQSLQNLPYVEGITVDFESIEGIPVTIARSTSSKRDKSNPLLIQAYGAYGISMLPYFDPSTIALLRHGWTVVFAHIRGGIELGRDWHNQGRLLNKKNSAFDLMKVTESFHEQGWSQPSMTVGKSWSAGALAFGMVANERPDLFCAMVMRSPFLNILESMMDPSLPLTVAEYDEWGNPSRDQNAFEYIRSYDPVLNIGNFLTKPATPPNARMPSMFITCSLKDQRVPYWGACTYVAKLRELKERGPSKLVFKWSEDESHFGAGSTSDQLADRANENAFLWSCTSRTHK